MVVIIDPEPSSGTNTASLALSPCYTLTLLLPTCIPYPLPYLMPSMPSPPVPLREVAGADGIIRVHVPFSMTDLSQIEKRLGSFSNDSASYIKEFKYLTQAYDMT
jgi:hypothetical protein